ncbi:hypothetical protein VIBHAR_06051 [Vibrio campbellii ATCC BAA-1116]|uniref:Uncharacterized protein n=1 Tax=Vibrio campbellii (strain ATCC BAA-1116) TaxID=2902295 RepID=A7N6T7_VIBC1|nr:hypothetical protein VIBHAR_06051 [Vibrio campbellii ATCC BAA-1116]
MNALNYLQIWRGYHKESTVFQSLVANLGYKIRLHLDPHCDLSKINTVNNSM